jgi:hypothetical protein
MGFMTIKLDYVIVLVLLGLTGTFKFDYVVIADLIAC